MTAQLIFSLPAVAAAGNSDPEPLRDQIERGLVGTDQPTVPGNSEEDAKYAFKRSLPTVVLYDAEGLRLYDRITADAPEYYLFNDELNLLRHHGDEIARSMGFPGRKARSGSTGGSHEEETPMFEDNFPPPKPWKPARWGDVEVGKFNNGVNGEEGLAGGAYRGYDVVELGAGALRKTAHLLIALAEALPPAELNGDDSPPPIAYHALDLSRDELDRVLGQLHDNYGDKLAGSVTAVGLHGDYDAGLKFVRDGGLASITDCGNCMDGESNGLSSSPTSTHTDNLVTPSLEALALPEAGVAAPDDDVPMLSTSVGMKDPLSVPPMITGQPANDDCAFENMSEGASTLPRDSNRPCHFVFLGSSLGNFSRDGAPEFLRALPLRDGDTVLVGLDGRPARTAEGKHKLEMAYNDPAGVTKAFEEHGWAVSRKELGLEEDKDGVEFTGRYNVELGRYESYLRSTKDQTLHLPGRNVDVDLKKGELLHLEWSCKYSISEALGLFDKSDLRVINSWKAPDSEYRLWLLERPAVRFANPAAGY